MSAETLPSKPGGREREAEKIALKRWRFAAALGEPTEASLGDLLDRLVYCDGLDDSEPFERRALGMVSNLLDLISQCDCGVPRGVVYQIHMMTEVLVEIGARLEEAGPPQDSDFIGRSAFENSPHGGEKSEAAEETDGGE
jgi:hypothetical protein